MGCACESVCVSLAAKHVAVQLRYACSRPCFTCHSLSAAVVCGPAWSWQAQEVQAAVDTYTSAVALAEQRCRDLEGAGVRVTGHTCCVPPPILSVTVAFVATMPA